MTYARRLQELQSDPSTSYWLKAAADTLNRRDPLDAAADAAALAELAALRWTEATRG